MSVTAAIVKSTPAKRVSLNFQTGRLGGPITYMLFGVEGVGKSTFGSDSPDAVFIDVERGTRELSVARVPEPEDGWTWPDVLDAVRLLETEKHDRKTLVIDTLDELEALLWKHLCERDKKTSIEDYGYGKGYQAAIDEWRVLLAAVERLKAQRAMNIGLLAHCIVKTFKNPEGEDFDRYQPRMHEKAAGLLKGKADVVLFANFEVVPYRREGASKSEKAKGQSTGNRIIKTRRSAAYDGKNRHELPEQMPLNARGFFEAIRRFQAMDAAALRTAIEAVIPTVKSETVRKEAASALGRADSEQKLAQLLAWLREQPLA